jgi:hypothetical protein
VRLLSGVRFSGPRPACTVPRAPSQPARGRPHQLPEYRRRRCGDEQDRRRGAGHPGRRGSRRRTIPYPPVVWRARATPRPVVASKTVVFTGQLLGFGSITVGDMSSLVMFSIRGEPSCRHGASVPMGVTTVPGHCALRVEPPAASLIRVECMAQSTRRCSESTAHDICRTIKARFARRQRDAAMARTRLHQPESAPDCTGRDRRYQGRPDLHTTTPARCLLARWHSCGRAQEMCGPRRSGYSTR